MVHEKTNLSEIQNAISADCPMDYENWDMYFRPFQI